MYPANPRFVTDSAAQLVDRLTPLVLERGALTLGVTPKGFLLDGVAVDPLPPILREFAARLHRKNVGTIRVAEGVTATEVTAMLAALADHDAAEHVGREGWRSECIRIDPLLYDVVGFTDTPFDHELDEAFWGELVEAAFGRRLTDVEGTPTTAQVAEAITERVERSPEEARRVFEALASFSSAIAMRGDRGPTGARQTFPAALGALAVWNPQWWLLVAVLLLLGWRGHTRADDESVPPGARRGAPGRVSGGAGQDVDTPSARARGVWTGARVSAGSGPAVDGSSMRTSRGA